MGNACKKMKIRVSVSVGSCGVVHTLLYCGPKEGMEEKEEQLAPAHVKYLPVCPCVLSHHQTLREERDVIMQFYPYPKPASGPGNENICPP